MKILMLIVDEEHKEELEVLLQKTGVAGYTELPHAVGFGSTGRRMGSGAYPKTSAVIFSILEPAHVDSLAREVKQYCRDCGERLKMVSWDVEEVV
jgi:hypothetical protein